MSTTLDVENDKVALRHYKQLILSLPWWIIPMFVVIGVIAAYLITKPITPIYQESTTIMVSKVNFLQASNYDSVFVNENLAHTYAEMITSKNILSKVAQQLSISPGELENITATPIMNTQLIEINVEHTDPILVAEIANTIVNVFSKEIDQTQLDFASNQDKALEAQIHETESRITKLQEEIKALSKDDYERQLGNINKIIGDLKTQINQVEPATSQARKDELSSLLSLYQEQYVLLTTTGPKLKPQDPEFEQAFAALDQYRKIYNSQAQNYLLLKTTRIQNKVAVIQVDKAIMPDRPARPNLPLNLAVGFSAGLLLAIIYIFNSKLNTH